MTIGIDIDNTINNLTQATLDIYNSDYNDNLSIKDITEYYMEKFVKDDAKENFYEYFTDKRVWKSIKVIDGAIQYINQLHNDGHEIYFVTATEPTNVAKKSKWLSRLFPWLNPRKQLIVIHDKWLLGGIDILIDDYPKNLIGGDYHKILLDYAWNRDCKNNDICRVYSWKDVYTEISKLCKL